VFIGVALLLLLEKDRAREEKTSGVVHDARFLAVAVSDEGVEVDKEAMPRRAPRRRAELKARIVCILREDLLLLERCLLLSLSAPSLLSGRLLQNSACHQRIYIFKPYP